MRDVTHVITTIERGGAEKQLLVLIRSQVLSGRNVLVIPLKGKPELLGEIETAGAKIELDFLNLHPLIQIGKLVKRLNSDQNLTHAHLPRAELFCAIANFKNPLILSRHNAESFFPKAPKILSLILSRFVVMRSDVVIAISMAVANFLRSNKEVNSHTKINVVLYGLDSDSMITNRFAEKNVSPLQIRSEMVVGTVARIDSQKDFPTLLRAFKLVKDEVKDAKLVVVGDGPLRNQMELLAKSLGVSNSIQWVGRVDNVKDFYKLFDVFILTSLYEGFGLVLLESMASGIPVVASNNSAIPEVLGSNYPFLCTTGAPQEFADSILKLRDKALTAKMRDDMKARLRLFDPIKMRERIDEIYASLG
jgi:glycosyltransferase involved in cell wall biosynthesis